MFFNSDLSDRIAMKRFVWKLKSSFCFDDIRKVQKYFWLFQYVSRDSAFIFSEFCHQNSLNRQSGY